MMSSLFLFKYYTQIQILHFTKSIYFVLLLLGLTAYYILVERATLGSTQRRKGPNVVGFHGLLQSVADGVKLIVKEQIIPSVSNPIIFLLSPMITFFIGLGCWAVIPFGEGAVISNINLGILYLFSLSNLGVYAIIMSGWSSNSKYAFLGSVRSVAQMVSYEAVFGFTVVVIFILTGSLNLTDIVEYQIENGWFVNSLLPLAIIFFIVALAETNRHPFDLPEAEAELVSGYNVEYSSMPFSLFFLGEYLSILGMSSLYAILFFGGWDSPCAAKFFNVVYSDFFWFSLKVFIFSCIFVIIRAVTPRYRFDHLISLCWQILLPITIILTLIYIFIIFFMIGNDISCIELLNNIYLLYK